MLTRRSGERFTANIWPGFVDAMTAILLILMFILSIFMIVQSVLRDTISSQKIELDEQQTELSQLGNNLEDLQNELGMLRNEKSNLQILSSGQKMQLIAKEADYNVTGSTGSAITSNASFSVARLVGTPTISSPSSAILLPNSITVCLTVEPVPKPTFIPDLTNWHASIPAFFLRSSTSAMMFLNQLSQ